MLGLFQISDRQNGWKGWWEYFGFDTARYSDAVYNARLALLIYEYSGNSFAQWQCQPY